MAIPPPVGDVKPGNLYADAQSRALWLGVNTAVSPDGALLVSDITQIPVDIAAAESRANAFTNSQVATRAALQHSHLSTDVTDFATAVQGVVGAMPAVAFTRGMIMMWFGNPASVGVGSLAGWALCDGASYNVGGTIVTTPDLTDRFVIGSGNKPWGSKNALGFLSTAEAGSHSHTINNTTLGVNQIPAHAHTVNIATDAQGNHAHGYVDFTVQAGGGVFLESGGEYSHVGVGRGTDAAGNHAHNVSGNTSSVGSGQGHTHTEAAAGVHSHQVTSQQIRDTIPYLVLAFIMKL